MWQVTRSLSSTERWGQRLTKGPLSPTPRRPGDKHSQFSPAPLVHFPLALFVPNTPELVWPSSFVPVLSHHTSQSPLTFTVPTHWTHHLGGLLPSHPLHQWSSKRHMVTLSWEKKENQVERGRPVFSVSSTALKSHQEMLETAHCQCHLWRSSWLKWKITWMV